VARLVRLTLVLLVAAPASARAAPAGLPPDACPANTHASHPFIPYKAFRRPASGPLVPIFLDEYDPVDPGMPSPAAILIHGGGWTKGCRRLDDTEAANLRGAGFMVFSIDYRLACRGDEPGWGRGVLALCGWTFGSIDPGTGEPSPATTDIRDAIAWVRAHAGEYGLWNGKVAAVGSSAGGHLLLEAIALATSSSERPDVAATWSGLIEPGRFVLKPADRWASEDGCDHARAAADCWRALDQYLDAPGCGSPLDQDSTDACADGTEWVEGSPYVRWSRGSRASLVPVFFSNGGGPDDNEYRKAEQVPLRQANEFAALLPALGFGTGEFQECVVDTTAHGLRYLYDHSCEGRPPEESVMDTTVSFLKLWTG
jgi:acetyl esterase/lipase